LLYSRKQNGEFCREVIKEEEVKNLLYSRKQNSTFDDFYREIIIEQ
jgi:hypothetical protein